MPASVDKLATPHRRGRGWALGQPGSENRRIRHPWNWFSVFKTGVPQDLPAEPDREPRHVAPSHRTGDRTSGLASACSGSPKPSTRAYRAAPEDGLVAANIHRDEPAAQAEFDVCRLMVPGDSSLSTNQRVEIPQHSEIPAHITESPTIPHGSPPYIHHTVRHGILFIRPES